MAAWCDSGIRIIFLDIPSFISFTAQDWRSVLQDGYMLLNITWEGSTHSYTCHLLLKQYRGTVAQDAFDFIVVVVYSTV